LSGGTPCTVTQVSLVDGDVVAAFYHADAITTHTHIWTVFFRDFDYNLYL
jgi:hypothetical protein